MYNPIIRGLVNHYGEFYKSGLYPTFRMLNRILEKWAMRKYKKLRCRRQRAKYWLGRIAYQEPELFAQWQILGVRPAKRLDERSCMS
jgi:RNA-directed DNA polymerase